MLDGHGWSTLTLAGGRKTTTITGSYLSDCAGELAKAATRRIGGARSAEVVALVPKAEAADWLARWGIRVEEQGGSL